ncbi:DEAD/DEAH box helicase [Thiomicrorhabdus sediminis]|uniref:DEAD-box ATP-dependent RNA helicase RhpA n=1 Tax=Thiomicrorhabdus sediminis TaxID=2580412 RepID=A0A4P9K5H7_9GAMM|nr:DEAD/DEAH box helicase [Thiomicrorhabdus sediminis]QCU90051.1 DEAD/DEAH box helicase [Thiomicrorhabdus sediminis]
MKFNDLGLNAHITKAIDNAGYTTPTPIQQQAIPAVLQGKDVMAAAQTGTGKTAAFTLPLLEKLSQGRKAKSNQARALILTPTRELALQVSESVETYGKELLLSSTVVYGGVKINPQMQRLHKGVDILVATPGRLLDLYQQNAIGFDELEILVLDEADRMLDMGFIRDIKKIIALLPKKRQNLLFSATFSDDIRALAKALVHQPVEISVTPENSTAETVKQKIYPVDKAQKTALLIKLIQDHAWYQVLVFARTKHGANRLATQLGKHKIKAAAIHGNKSQNARIRALNEFKDNQLQVLVATDIAARGIDIDLLPHVVNFDLPHVSEDYVHRIGRTGRAGEKGEAISLVCAEEHKELVGIENLINQILPREIVAGFEPKNPLGESKLGIKKKKPKKPKKKKPWQDSAATNEQKTSPKKKRPANNSRNLQTSDVKPGKPRSNKPTNKNATKPNNSSNQRQPVNRKKPNIDQGK